VAAQRDGRRHTSVVLVGMAGRRGFSPPPRVAMPIAYGTCGSILHHGAGYVARIEPRQRCAACGVRAGGDKARR